ncbi:MAG: cation transporter [Lentisphaerae bacterium GWF2_44_16]|nr:MAG: cation transporter [Lentisphaerae bacterium GWF2_44_16]
MDINGEKSFIALLSVISNALLVVMKLAAGLVTGSVSILSEAIHSGMDLVASMIALFAVRASAKPADEDHPFGHGKFENISGAVEALLIFLAAGWIIFEAVKKLLHPQPLHETSVGILVMLISSIVNIFISMRLFKIGRETDSVALLADAWHLRTDVYTSVGVMLGLAGIWLLGFLFPSNDFQWIDPVAAILVAVLILKAAYDLTVTSVKDLLDIGLPDEDMKLIINKVSENERVCGLHGLRSRKSGAVRFVEFHLKLEPDMTVMQSHLITEKIENDIRNIWNACELSIHVEPCSKHCSTKCLSGCFLRNCEDAHSS